MKHNIVKTMQLCKTLTAKAVPGRKDTRAEAYSAPDAGHPRKPGGCSFTRRRGTETYTARHAESMNDV